MNKHVPEPQEGGDFTVSVFKNGRSRAVRLPKEIELDGNSVVMVRQPDGSILMRTGVTAGLVAYLQQADAWAGEDFVTEEDDVGPLREVDL
ncbi:AbrB/MazE/SpoVT family DNA-binding domain-containing protein [Agrobacterium sp. a22-2]|uniref:antitoxin n=1 Tax=Agrobacterium sp. a22-2 TaxID=2283840 RepID=UPI0014454EA3|nr:AbrB/MazE/SpoVT family DNA-binding domain-containing protein [Agrobacterium sp. a22-2]NKN35494.1 AbrB/MazE/SpoVT family DNA-binding domain-containing protein [Agrobacterium sp. a22-2]